jgi:hypothetical protein
MNKKIAIAICLALSCVAAFESASYAGRRGGSVNVRGYFRKNGTYVRPHTRTAPDGICSNNISGCSSTGSGHSGSFGSSPQGTSGIDSSATSSSSYFSFAEKLFIPDSRDYLMCMSSEIINSPVVVYHVYVSEAVDLPANIMCYGYQTITRNQKAFRKISTLKNEEEAKYLAKLVKGWYAKETVK